MASSKGSYGSVFRVKGTPILPPVINDHLRVELQRDKRRALAVEQRLNINRKIRSDAIAIDQSLNNVSENTMVTDGVEHSPTNCDTSAAVESITEDSSRTIGNIASDDIDDQSNTEQLFMKNMLELNIDSIGPLSVDIDVKETNNLNGDTSPGFSLHSSPSLGALNDSRNQSLYFKPMSARQSLSPISDVELKSFPLIRSNSYTIEKPSEMLLEHMQASDVAVNSKPKNLPIIQLNGIVQCSTSMRPIKAAFNESKSKDVKNKATSCKSVALAPIQSNESTTKLSISKKKPSQSSVFKNSETVLRSIYGPPPNSARKINKKENGTARNTSRALNKSKSSCIESQPAKPTQKIESAEPTVSNQASQTTQSPQAAVETVTMNEFHKILRMIEDQHAVHMNELIERQRAEQQRMQEEFQRQQDGLLRQIASLVLSQSGNSSIQTNRTAIDNTANLSKSIEVTPNDHTDSNGNHVNHSPPDSAKCNRRLYFNDHKTVSAELMRSHSTKSSPKTLYTEREIAAATTINAFTRGYLTRRLFKTSKINDIVKTIRDTLLFILDIHYENNENETMADIELKSHLIQQLTSANYNLHNIFVKLPMAERMDIIAKDREWQQLKMFRKKSQSANGKYKHSSAAAFGNSDSHMMKSMTARADRKY